LGKAVHNSRPTGIGGRRRRIALRLTLGCVTLLALALCWRTAAKQGRLDFFSGVCPIENLRGIRAGSRVRLRGVVTYYDFGSASLYLQDRTGAIHIGSLERDWRLHAGELIEVQGETTADFDEKIGPDSTDISHAQVWRLGESDLPTPLRISAGNLPPTGRSSERVEVHGIVRAASREDGGLTLDFSPKDEHRLPDELLAQSIRLPLIVKDGGSAAPDALVDADIVVRGVFAETPPSGNGGANTLRLLAMTLADVQVERPPPQHPIEAPSLHALFTDYPLINAGHRLEVRGQVVSQDLDEHIVVIADEAGALPIETNETTAVKPGEMLEVQGFPANNSTTTVLEDATFRRVSAAPNSHVPINLPILTTVRQVHVLTPEQAALGYPIRIQGMVTYYDPHWRHFFMQDSTAGIYSEARDQGNLRAGQRVRIEGTSAPGGYAPVIVQPHIQILGLGPLPKPQKPSAMDAISGEKDAQWGEMEGIVHPMHTDEAGNVSFQLYTGLGLVAVHTSFFPSEGHLERMIDARVRARGVIGTRFNPNRQIVGLALFIGSPGDLTVLEPGAADPFSAEVRPISQLLQFSPKGEPGHRQRVRGVVTMHRPGSDFYLEDATGALQIQTDDVSAKTGDLVDAVGYAEPGEYSAVLQDAAIRRIGSGISLSAPPITPEEALTGKFSNQLVAIEARVLSHVAKSAERRLILQAGNFTFDAELGAGGKGGPELDALRDGSVVRLTGICSVQVDRSKQYLSNYGAPNLSSFHILLRTPDDIQVLRNASWWTLDRALGAVAALLLTVATGVIWVVVLRRKVRSQTADLVRAEKLAALGRLAAGVAHELNNPLTGIFGYIQILQDDDRTGAHREKLNKMAREARRMSGIIENLINFTKPRGSGRQSSDIETVVRRALMLCEYNLKSCNINVHVLFDSGLPRLDLDENQLTQVFLDLFNNSADALEEVSDRRISVEGHLEGDQLTIRFSDTGPGFSDVNRVFDPFYTTKPAGKGTGLGLSICQGIVTEHGGTIEAHNVKPHGAEVTITFRAGKTTHLNGKKRFPPVPSLAH
jgi:signal transduction histidine kinase